jgi:hypothetical protein
MNRAVLQACLPWMALLAASCLAAWLLARLSRATPRPARLLALHRDQRGSVQSLSFVVTLPLFVWIMMMIVQVSQLMIGTIMVHYAAFAAARSAAVWIPANLPAPEQSNCISSYYPDPEATDQVFPVLNPADEGFRPIEGGVTYRVEPGGPKFAKIASAAVLACTPISPSRDMGLALPAGMTAADVLKTAYAALVPGSSDKPGTNRRLDHKLAYAASQTQIEIRFFHKNEEPPLATWYLGDDLEEFRYNEIGWQDQITVTVRYPLALLPGPGRLLARKLLGPSGEPDRTSEAIQQKGGAYVYPLSASACIGNEGEKSVVPYVYWTY